MKPRTFRIAIGSVVLVAVTGCGGAHNNLNQTTTTCPVGRTLLDGVCVSEPVADYVACVRAQGASLGGSRAEKFSAEAGAFGVKAAGAHEVSDKLEKKYSVSAGAELEVIRACANKAGATACQTTKEFSGFAQSFKCPDDRDVVNLGARESKESCLEACKQESKAAGCWYLDGSNGFPRDCRACRTMSPVRDQYPNDWAGAITTACR